MQEVETTWWRVFRVYWLFMWRAMVGALVFGFIVGFVIGFVGSLSGFRADQYNVVIFGFSFIFGVVWSVIVVRMALKKRYSDFRIVLVPVTAAEF